MGALANPVKNVYQYFVDVTIANLMGNISTLQQHNLTLDVITNCNNKLSQSWTTGGASGKIAEALKEVQAGKMSIHDFIQKYLAAGSATISDFSQAVGSQIMHLLAKAGEGKDQSMDMSVVNSFNSIITSTANNEQQIGQNLSKTQQSVVQQDAGAQQPLADIGNAIAAILAAIASLIQQVY